MPKLAAKSAQRPPGARAGASRERPTRQDLEALATFRYELRRFLRFSETAATAAGLTSLQYQLLLQVAGYPERSWATIGELAERLQTAHHGVVALVTRCESAGLVERRRGELDRREVHVHLSALGARKVRQVAAVHRRALGSLERVLHAARLWPSGASLQA
jgi:DNA-binding MarR family transcriptional regulator